MEFGFEYVLDTSKLQRRFCLSHGMCGPMSSLKLSHPPVREKPFEDAGPSNQKSCSSSCCCLLLAFLCCPLLCPHPQEGRKGKAGGGQQGKGRRAREGRGRKGGGRAGEKKRGSQQEQKQQQQQQQKGAGR
eukprot:6871692-Pyramimonas_sp.AAC.1